MSSGTSTACCRSASSSTISSARAFVAARTTPRPRPPGRPAPQPPDGDDAPRSPGQAGEPYSGRGVVRSLPSSRCISRKSARRPRGPCASRGPRGRCCSAVPVEPGDRVGAARLERAAEHVALVRGSGCTGAPRAGRGAVVGAGPGWHGADVTEPAPEELWPPTPESIRATRVAAFAAWVAERRGSPSATRPTTTPCGAGRSSTSTSSGATSPAGPTSCPGSPTTGS